MNKLFSKIKNMTIQEKIVMVLWILVAIFLIAEVAVLVVYQPTIDSKVSNPDTFGWQGSADTSAHPELFKVIKHDKTFDNNIFTKTLNDVKYTFVMGKMSEGDIVNVTNTDTNSRLIMYLGKWVDSVLTGDAINANNVIAGISFVFGSLLLGTVGTTVIVAYHKKHNRYFWQKSRGGGA